MATLEKAIELTARAHCGMKDQQGLLHILPPIRLMLCVVQAEAHIVAALRDTIENNQLRGLLQTQ